MKNATIILAATLFALSLGALPARPAGLGTVICESKDGERQHCPAS